MAVYSPSSLKITAPPGGFQQGGWYGGRQYWGGTLSEVNQIHPSSNQGGAGTQVSQEVQNQSAAQQNVTPQQFTSYLDQQRQQQAQTNPTPAANPAPAPGGAGAGSPLSGGALGSGLPSIPGQTEFNLPSLYESLYKSAGISDIEKELQDQEKAFTETKGKINDNPFLSEATRVGRIAKMESLYTERTANKRNELAMKKADIETRLNLETKQFDINSQVAQQNLNRLNVLLQNGFLDNASGDDIASLTRATGISSQAIQGAINYNKAKNVPTSLVQIDDGTNITAVLMNTQTGDVINSTILGKSKPAGASAGSTAKQEKLALVGELEKDAKSGKSLSQMFGLYAGLLEPNEIYQYYNTYSKYGADKGADSAAPGYLGQYGVTLFK